MRSKADYYPNHLFLRVLCHKLATDADPHDSLEALEHLRRVEFPEPINREDGANYDSAEDREATACGWNMLRERMIEAEVAEQCGMRPLPGSDGKRNSQYMRSERKVRGRSECSDMNPLMT